MSERILLFPEDSPLNILRNEILNLNAKSLRKILNNHPFLAKVSLPEPLSEKTELHPIPLSRNKESYPLLHHIGKDLTLSARDCLTLLVVDFGVEINQVYRVAEKKVTLLDTCRNFLKDHVRELGGKKYKELTRREKTLLKNVSADF